MNTMDANKRYKPYFNILQLEGYAPVLFEAYLASDCELKGSTLHIKSTNSLVHSDVNTLNFQKVGWASGVFF